MSDQFGFDKDARLAKKRTGKAEKDKPEPLQPAFPYAVIPFDPEFFNVPANPNPTSDG
jgi:hypothetical protein